MYWSSRRGLWEHHTRKQHKGFLNTVVSIDTWKTMGQTVDFKNPVSNMLDILFCQSGQLPDQRAINSQKVSWFLPGWWVAKGCSGCSQWALTGSDSLWGLCGEQCALPAPSSPGQLFLHTQILTWYAADGLWVGEVREGEISATEAADPSTIPCWKIQLCRVPSKYISQGDEWAPR